MLGNTVLVDILRRRKAERAETVRQLETDRLDQEVKLMIRTGRSIDITDFVIKKLERREIDQRAHIARLEACLRRRGVG